MLLGGDPVVGKIASMVQRGKLTDKLHVATLELSELDKLDVKTPENRARLRDSLKGVVKIAEQFAKVIGMPV